MKCDYCGRDEALPFICNYCGGVFCPDHRLPEAHQCRGDLTQKRTIVAPPQTTFSWQESTVTPVQTPTFQRGKIFSGIEIRDIIIAWLALGVAFSFVIAEDLLGINPIAYALSGSLVLYFVGISLITVGTGFVFHELSHKFVAQRYGYWAEFRMWPMGLVLALVTSLLGFTFAAPGATYISGTNITQGENGRISIAGPLTNVAIAILFSPFLLLNGNYFLMLVGFFGVHINVFLAMFNLLPVGPLDGAKVFKWNLPVWILVFIPLVVAFFFLYV